MNLWPFKSKAKKQAEQRSRIKNEAAINHRVIGRNERIRARLEADLLDPNLPPARRKNHEDYLARMD